jgi:RNA polymerase sigma-70 factor (ECF subfamily)
MVAFCDAQRAWPGVALTQGAFDDHLRRVGWIDALPQYVSELYLCCACLQLDAQAWRHFEARYVSFIAHGVRKVCCDPHEVEEAVQVVRDKLGMGPRPKLASYTGRGPLGAWLQVVAVRTMLDRVRKTQAAAKIAAPLSDSTPSLESSIEGKLDRARFAGALGTSLKDALRSLSARERGVLRLHYVDGCNIDAIGGIYGVHRATVARWLANMRERLRGQIRASLSPRIALTDSELGDVTRGSLALSELGLS